MIAQQRRAERVKELRAILPQADCDKVPGKVDSDETLTISEAAELIGRTDESVRNYEKLGLRINREPGKPLTIKRSDLKAFAESHPERVKLGSDMKPK